MYDEIVLVNYDYPLAFDVSLNSTTSSRSEGEED